MIVIVDEDVKQMDPLKRELQIREFEVELIDDAEDAYSRLAGTGDELDLAIIDIMLRGPGQATSERFTRARTEDFIKTGLYLLEDLIAVNSENFPSKAVLFSTALDEKLVAAIERAAKEYPVEYLPKMDYRSALRLGEKIAGIVARGNG